MLVPYLVAQTSISEFIEKVRLERITEIQAQVYNYLGASPTSVSEKRLENLLLIYGKAIDTKPSTISINPQIVNSLLLPLLSLVLINFDRIYALVQLLLT